jgi:hypothetical protein
MMVWRLLDRPPEPVIGPAKGWTRWQAMTAKVNQSTAVTLYRNRVGHMMVRHMWADGLLSQPRPSFGWRKLRPMMSSN